MVISLKNGFSMRPTRPRHAAPALHDEVLAHIGLGNTSSLMSRSWLFSALAMADSSVFLTSPAMRLREKVRSASAFSTFLPRMIDATH
jgi:hypothetical protein